MHRSPRLVLLLMAAVGAAGFVGGSASEAARPTNGCPLPCSGQSVSPFDRKLLFVQPAGARGPMQAYDTSTGRRRFALPAGVASADGRWFYAAAARAGATRLRRFDVPSGRAVHAFSLRGRWALAGVSPSGRWLALSRQGGRPLRTTVAVVDAVNGRPAHRLTLRGDFEVETVSTDGKRLFLVEHLRSAGSPRYLVRLFDLSRERLRVRPLRAAGDDRVMAGYAWSGIASPDGRWLLTLYLNTLRSRAFVHALDLNRSSPLCIDLPSGRGALAQLKRYALILSPDGQTLYAANAALGAVAEIDLRTRRVVRTARFAPGGVQAAPHPSTLGGTISRDGRTLYFSGGRDLWAYDTRAGRVRGPYASGGPLVGFGFGNRDRRVHALRADGRMVTFDAATGGRLGA